MSNSPVFVLGRAQTDLARNWSKENKHIVAMMREAMLGGLEAARLDPSDVETAHIGNFAAELDSNQGHLGAFVVDIDPAFFRIADQPARGGVRLRIGCDSGGGGGN
jgi:acetyl-CoA C-acetyltransferase